MKRFYITAKALKIHASSNRAITMIREAWPVAAAYHSCLLERNATWLKENALYSRTEVECWIIRERSWRRFFSSLLSSVDGVFFSEVEDHRSLDEENTCLLEGGHSLQDIVTTQGTCQ